MANRVRNKNVKSSPNRPINRNTNRPINRNRLRNSKRPLSTDKPKRKGIADARQKIMQKKRRNVVDARDILARMAKKQDARNKIAKLREGKTTNKQINGNVQAVGSNILRKTDRNGRISLVTNKTKHVPTDINLAIKQQLGLVSPVRSPRSNNARQPLSPRARNVPRTLSPTLIRKTILNDEYPYQPSYGQYAHVYDSDLYRWVKPDLRSSSVVGSRRPFHASRSHEDEEDWRLFSRSPTRPLRAPTTYIDLDAMEDEDMPLVPPIKQTISLQGPSRSSNVHSRLDNYAAESQTHGILSQTKTKVLVPAGHRIVVSNLQPTVTQDDIKELFEDIGQLLIARLVRPGTAEVIYKNLKDAQKAVDTYHNRQLDGQPMKCLLVNKRPLNNPIAPAKSASEGILSSGRSASVSNNKLVPDISTIHKVLFQRK